MALYRFRREEKRRNILKISLVHILAYCNYVWILTTEKHLCRRGYLQHLVNYVCVMGRGNLGSVFPVGLVAVILLGVMRCGNHHSALASEMAYRITEFRSGPQRIKQIYPESVCRKHICSNLGKFAAVVPAVIRNCNFYLVKILEISLHVVGYTLRGHAHRIFVHSVGADPHNASQSSGAELQMSVKTLFQFFSVVVNKISDSFSGLGIVLIAQP